MLPPRGQCCAAPLSSNRKGRAALKIIYYCFAGAHASVVASAIHCGLLPVDRVPPAERFLAIPYYDRTSRELVGRLYHMGVDEFGNNVHFMGLWNQRDKAASVIRAILDIAGVDKREYLLQDTFPLINFSTKFGGLLSKHRWLLGRSMTIWGVQRQYPMFVELVASVKKQLE